MRKKLLSILLIFCMITTLLSISIMAEEVYMPSEVGKDIITSVPLAEIEESVTTTDSAIELPILQGLLNPMAAIEYDLWVGDVRVTSANADNVLGDGTVSYDADNKTLTLNGANITTATISQYNDKICILANELILNLVGANSITGVSTGTSNYGIKCRNLTIQGEGSLTVTSGRRVQQF